jgi:hypothetical protein
MAKNAAGVPIIYAMGGCCGTSGKLLKSVHAYNTATNTWTLKAPMPVGKWQTNGTVFVGGKLYVLGGWRESDASPSGGLLAYAPGTNTWQVLTGNCCTASGASGLIGGKIFELEGTDGGGFQFSHLDRYDPVTRIWTFLGFAKVQHFFPGGAGVIGGKFYVAGGRYDWENIITDMLEVYDPGTNTWVTKAPTPTIRYNGASTVPNGSYMCLVDKIRLAPSSPVWNPTTRRRTSGPQKIQCRPRWRRLEQLQSFLEVRRSPTLLGDL